MARTDFRSIDEYVAAQPAAAQAVLARVRSAIAKALPGAEEAISYQIPAFKRGGTAVIHFAAWKQHYSVYPASAAVVAALAGALAPYQVSKGTIRFPLSQPVPATLIARIAKLRAKEVAAAKKAKAK